MHNVSKETLSISKEEIIESISRDSLDCIESVGSTAEEQLARYRSSGAGAFASVNTFTSTEQVRNIGRIEEAQKKLIEALAKEPVIARVSFEDEDGTEKTVFITRASPPLGSKNIASYRSPLGRLASIPAGDEFEAQINGRRQDVLVRSSAKLRPRKEAGQWDSRDTEIDSDTFGKVSIASLRAYLEPIVGQVEDDILEAILAADETPNVLDGIRRSVLSHIGLRDQPILDKFQDEIFRLPINTRCFLSGPPGSGKTTTLIRRLGQKLDADALEPTELSLIQRAEISSDLDHQKSWIMFSPTELLRQYVKEAFAREGLAASDDHIKTWTDFRRELARNTLGILRTGTHRGHFVERPNDSYLDPRCGTSDAAVWFEDFDTYFKNALLAELQDDIEWFLDSGNERLRTIANKLSGVLARNEELFSGTVAPEFSVFSEEIESLVGEKRAEEERIFTLCLNRILRDDRAFLDAFGKEFVAQRAAVESSDVAEDDEDDDESDFGEDDSAGEAIGRGISARQAKTQYERVIRSAAAAAYRKRKVPDRSLNGRLLAWLGSVRMPNAEELATLGQIAAERRRLRKFANVATLFVNRVPREFKKYRRERAKEGRWFVTEPNQNNDICWKELDLIILAMLRAAGEILSAYRAANVSQAPTSGILGRISDSYRNQILVDEASDFSILQLATMYELANPSLRSFFACGDFNQRLTEWGITSNADLDWIDAKIERRNVTVSYRQTAKLVALAKRVAALGGTTEADIILPDRVDIEGVAPVWAGNLPNDDAVSRWIANRIREIETMVKPVPSIAVLVHDESRVEPLSQALGRHLQDMSLNAVACKDGKVVGNDRDVRVFNLEHIKGLEFEAVFFADLDEMISKNKELYTKFLYVGATRAATYLGATFNADVSAEVASLADLFASEWAV